ncbi:uncharacterized protein LOC132194707 [Neocloeon triangulifer]|uniref:uncharacterized protein LOC132194707 n=1 Tax=Neocloeon triangulifer TaxID=2078957 RepID=UPI00286F97C6|nr:uncharacterized protein LOC132194707 [Neocloeon triangulifer]
MYKARIRYGDYEFDFKENLTFQEVGFLVVACQDMKHLKIIIQANEGTKIKNSLLPSYEVSKILGDADPPKFKIPRSASEDQKQICLRLRRILSNIKIKAKKSEPDENAQEILQKYGQRIHRAKIQGPSDKEMSSSKEEKQGCPPKKYKYAEGQEKSNVDLENFGLSGSLKSTNSVLNPVPINAVSNLPKTEHPGFKNPGVYCYLISSVQLLLSASPFVKIFEAMTFSKILDIKELDALKLIVDRVARSNFASQNDLDNAILDLGHLTVSFGMAKGEQQDPVEIITLILPHLASKLKKIDKNADPVTPFLMSTISLCRICKNVFGNTDPGIFLTVVPNVKLLNIQELIEHSLRDDRRCCCAVETLQSKFLVIPDCLLVQVARNRYGSNIRSKDHVQISKEIALPVFGETHGFNDEYDKNAEHQMPTDALANIKKSYQLKAIILHQGTQCDRGHYICYTMSKQEKQWLLCDDSKISVVKNFDDDILNADSTKEDCYVLLYEAVGHTPAARQR